MLEVTNEIVWFPPTRSVFVFGVQLLTTAPFTFYDGNPLAKKHFQAIVSSHLFAYPWYPLFSLAHLAIEFHSGDTIW